jgi:glyoxylase-like metal-dependent hydrolase (beta-lactamase superfamily II)
MELEELFPSRLGQALYRMVDTCNVYALQGRGEVVLIDFGSGAILQHLADAGLPSSPNAGLSRILMTHHHRDQGQGLPLAAQREIPIWVPHTEQDLFRDVDAHWQARSLMNDYNNRQDRFSLLEPVPVAGTLKDYARLNMDGATITILPTPGHTTGSISLLVEGELTEGKRLAFTGDLIAAPGKVWSLAATQWTYNGAEGAAATILSLLALKEQKPDVLLPSHGEPITDPEPAIDLLIERLWELLQRRGQNTELFELRERPYVPVTEHILRNRTSMANNFVLLSESGKALFFDFGYDYVVGQTAGSDRASRRPWLYNLETLKRQYGISQIEVAIPTHFHDDHVAGLNLLRDVEGTEIWAAENFASILEDPHRYNLPCLWYDPIPVDRVLPLSESGSDSEQSQTIRWQEYELTLYALPGHTRYAAAIALEVDGHRVLVSGDQYQGADGLEWNYVYRNEFEIDDYRASAALYRHLAPDLILTGHWKPQWVEPGYFDALEEHGEALSRLHRELLPEQVVNSGVGGFPISIEPYQSAVTGGEPLSLTVEVRNPYDQEVQAFVSLVAPGDDSETEWDIKPREAWLSLPPSRSGTVTFTLIPPSGRDIRRARVGANLVVGGRSDAAQASWGQQAEALVNVRKAGAVHSQSADEQSGAQEREQA